MIQILARTGIQLAYVDHVPFSERMYAVGVVGILAIIYMIPTGIAVFGKHPAAVGIAALNITLGWTGIVWIVVFIWACIKPRQPVVEMVPRYLKPSPPPIPSKPRLETSLEELHQLKNKNLINEQEFQERRKQLLERL